MATRKAKRKFPKVLAEWQAGGPDTRYRLVEVGGCMDDKVVERCTVDYMGQPSWVKAADITALCFLDAIKNRNFVTYFEEE